MSSKSATLFEQAKQLIPGGVNSPVRAFGSVGGNPPFITRASGSRIYDADGKEYLDYVCSWGPMILGHAPKQVIDAIERVALDGTSFGAPTELEVKLAQLVVDAVPSIEMVRMVSSGTEATMSAIRLARGYTGRDRIIKFAGCYHGHVDSLLVEAGSGVMTMGIPGSPGIPADLAKLTVSLPFNNLDAVTELLASEGDSVAAIILEPIPANMGVVIPDLDFLKGLRELATQYGIVLIFDEVISGFRVALGGAQEYYGITPDLTCLGKIIGGGLPVGAYGGKRAIMEKMSPLGPVYQAGTLSGNPLAMAAGIATLETLAQPGFYDTQEEKGAYLAKGLTEAASNAGVSCTMNRIGSLATTFFTASQVTDYESAKGSDTARFAKYFHNMLDLGINLAPSQFEAAFISQAHSMADLDLTIEAANKALKNL